MRITKLFQLIYPDQEQPEVVYVTGILVLKSPSDLGRHVGGGWTILDEVDPADKLVGQIGVCTDADCKCDGFVRYW